MSLGGSGLPPFPVNDFGTGSPDPAPSATYTAESDLNDMLNWMKQNAADIGGTLGNIWDNSHLTEKAIAFFTMVFADIVTAIATVEAKVLETWTTAEAAVYANAVQPLEAAAAAEAQTAMGILLQAMGGGIGGDSNFGSSPMAATAQQLFNSLVQPFTLMTSGINPSQVGSGINAQQYLLEKASGMLLQEWIVEQLGNHLGMGFFKTLAPFLGIIDRSINPSNIVRQAMDSSFTFLLKAPLTRDLNRQYPIKDLGVTALARMFIRGVIDENTYLDRCLDSGINNLQAQQLILESAKLLSEGDIALLLNLGYLQQSDAQKLMAQFGYQPATVTAKLYLDTHKRYFQIQERVGYQAVTAAKHGYISQSTMEQILKQTGFTADEITLLDIELQFVKTAVLNTRDHMTYGQIRALYMENIISIDDVIAFLQSKEYTQQEVIDLVLLDFTQAAERTAVRNTLVARLRVEQNLAQTQSVAEAAKNEQLLAAAKLQLAGELEAEANTFGRLSTGAGVLTSLGLLP